MSNVSVAEALAASVAVTVTDIVATSPLSGVPLKVREADFAVAISDYNRRLIERECGSAAAGKLHVIHCGVDPEVFGPRPAQREAGRFRMLCIGSLHEVKGQATLIDACSILRERGLDFECRLIGGGPDRRRLLRRIRRDIRYKAILELWLVLHVPLSLACLAAIAVHVLAVFYYR